MTSLLEKIVTIIAPNYCISCSKQDNILCESCVFNEQNLGLPACILCARPSKDWRLCEQCSRTSSLRYVWPAALYEGHFERVIHLLKFERLGAAHLPLSTAMLAALPYDDWLVVPLPTAARRVRQRGYDQAVLLAKVIAKTRDLRLQLALERVQNTRQLGANRVQRQKQSTKMFCMAPRANVQGAKILLVDDVCTTGATLTAAAQLLKQAGATQIDAVVAAWQPPK